MEGAHLFLLLSACVFVTSSAALIKRRADFPFENLEEKDLYTAKDVDLFNKLVIRLIDAAIEDAKERGTNDVIVDDMIRKRSGIRRCFFHAVNCW